MVCCGLWEEHWEGESGRTVSGITPPGKWELSRERGVFGKVGDGAV